MTETIFAQLKRIVPSRWHWVLEHEGFRRYFANTGWLFGGQLVNLGLSFIIGVWVARHLGPANYGVLNYALGLAGIFGFLAIFGIDNILSRELIRRPQEGKTLLGSALVAKAIGGLLAFGASVSLAFVVGASPLIKLLVAIYALSYIFQPLNLLSSFFQARVEARYNVKAQVWANIISSAMKVAWIFSGAGVIYLMAIYLLDSLFNIVFLWIIYWRHKENIFGWRFNYKAFWYLFRSGWPLLLSGAATFMLFKIDQVMIGKMMGEVEVGLYAAAAKLSEVWHFIPTILCSSLFPAIINAKTIGDKIYRLRVRNFFILMATLSLIIVIPIFFLAKLLITYLFGPDYLLALPVLRIHVFSSIGIFMGYAVTQYLIAENRETDVFRGYAWGAVINIGLNLWLIPLLGISGAAISTLVAYSVLPVYAWTKRKL